MSIWSTWTSCESRGSRTCGAHGPTSWPSSPNSAGKKRPRGSATGWIHLPSATNRGKRDGRAHTGAAAKLRGGGKADELRGGDHAAATFQRRAGGGAEAALDDDRRRDDAQFGPRHRVGARSSSGPRGAGEGERCD